jgi:neutral ceramidase
MKLISFLTLFSAFLFAGFQANGQSERTSGAAGVLKAGMAKTDITPEIPVKLYGYASRKTLSEGVHDKLYARAVVFESNGKKIVMISTDIGSYTDTLYSVISKAMTDNYGIKDSEFFLSAIHSHSSPVVSLNPERIGENNVQYTKSLEKKLVDLVGVALKNLAPVSYGSGVGYSPVGSNRREQAADGSIVLGRNPYGPTDKEVLVLKLAGSDGKPVGAVFDYATHATSLGPANMLISGDVLGISEQFVERYLDNNIITPVFAGASGNIDPWYRILPSFNSDNGWIPETVLLGTLLGEEVVHVFNDIETMEPTA